MDIKHLQPVEMSKTEVRKTVLTNTVKMITERGLLDLKDLESNIKMMLNQVDKEGVANMEYKINLDKELLEDKSRDILYIKIVPLKITAIHKSSDIASFLNKHSKQNKLIIMDSVGKKAIQYIRQHHPDAELFTEEELMINIVEHVSVPVHQLLSKEEVETFYKQFNCKKKDMPRILSGDPVARYYNMKPNDIVKILRPSETSGVAPFYRLVVKGDMKK